MSIKRAVAASVAAVAAITLTTVAAPNAGAVPLRAYHHQKVCHYEMRPHFPFNDVAWKRVAVCRRG